MSKKKIEGGGKRRDREGEGEARNSRLERRSGRRDGRLLGIEEGKVT